MTFCILELGHQTYSKAGCHSVHFLRQVSLKTTSTALCGHDWPGEGRRGVEVLDLCSEQSWEKLDLSFWAADDLRISLNLSKLSGHEGPEQPGQEQVGSCHHFFGWLAQHLWIRENSFQTIYSEDTENCPEPQLEPGCKTDHVATRSYWVYYDQMALVMSYQHCCSGAPAVDKGAANHTHPALIREEAGGCSVLRRDAGKKLCTPEQLIPARKIRGK